MMEMEGKTVAGKGKKAMTECSGDIYRVKRLIEQIDSLDDLYRENVSTPNWEAERAVRNAIADFIVVLQVKVQRLYNRVAALRDE